MSAHMLRTSVRPRGAAAEAARPRPGLALAVVLFGYLVLPMAMSGTTVAVPRIGADLGASGPALQWIVTGYFLAASSFMLVAGSLGDLFGRRRLYRIGAFVYLAGSFAAAAAPSIVVLDAARILTGLGGAGVMAGGGAILATTFTGAARTRAFAAMGTTSGIGLAAGPTTAGWLVEALDWRMTFALFGTAGLVLAAGTWALAESKAETRPTVDRAGIATFIGGLVLVMFAITQGSQAGWGSARVVLPAVAGMGLLAGFVVVERRVARPMLDLRLLKNRRFTGWLLAALTVTAGFGGLLANLPTFLQAVNGASTGEAGLTMLLPTVPVLVMPTVSARLVARGVVAPRTLVTVALLLIAAGNAWLTVLHPGIGALGLAGPLVTVGVGMGLSPGMIDAQVMDQVEPSRAGMAAGLLNTVRGTTQALTLAVFGSALISVLRSHVGGAADRVATGDLPSGAERMRMAAELSSAWHTVAVGVAGVVVMGAVGVWILLGNATRASRTRDFAGRTAASDRP